MRVRLICAIRDIFYVTLFVALVNFVFLTNVHAEMSEAKILEEISKQETGRLPGAWIAGSSGTDRNNFSVEVKFDAFQPSGDFERIERFPGDLKIPKCYYFDSRGDIVYTDNCSSVSPPAKPITKYYDEDGNELFGVGQTSVVHTGEGVEILFHGKKIYPITNEYVKHPADGTIFKFFAVQNPAPPPAPPPAGSDVLYPQKYIDIDDTVNGTPACDKLSLSGTYPPGYGYDYDTPSGPLEPIIPGGIMRYPIKVGQPVFDQSCRYLTDCSFEAYIAANPSSPTDISDPFYDNTVATPPAARSPNSYRIKAGDEIYIKDAGVCGRVKTTQGGPITSVRGPERILPTIVPLFLQRFRDDYAYSLYQTLLTNLGPTGTRVSTVTLTAEQYIPALPSPHDTTLISFESEYIGDYLCVFAYSKNPNIIWRVEDKAPQTMEEVLDLIPSVKKGSVDPGTAFASMAGVDNKHCVLAPPPAPITQTLGFHTLFSPTCQSFHNADSRWSGSITSGIVECIEDTLTNIFIKPQVGGDPTFFQLIQQKFQVLIRYLLVLYVIFFGYRLIIRKHLPDQGEWIWFGLRVGLVVLFVMSSGMAIVFEYTMVSLKSLSLIVVEASSDVSGSISVVHGGHCDFSNMIYPSGKEYIKLWDMIDCKASKYLGIGDNLSDTKTPQVIWIGAVAVVSTFLGIPILVITIIVLVCLLSLIARAVHLYILSFISLVLLFYISPLLLPAVLFDYTKDIFYKWFQKVLSNFLQPILLFAFLSFGLAIVDTVFFGDNIIFVSRDQASIPNNGGLPYHPGPEVPYHIGGGTGPGGKAIEIDQCRDPQALACIYQSAKITTHRPLVFPFNGIDFYKVGLNGKEVELFVGLLKLLLICFVVKALLDAIENMVGRITGANPVGKGRGFAAFTPSYVLGAQSAAVAGGSAVVAGGYKAISTSFKMVGRGGALAMAAMRAGTGGETLLEKDIRKRAAGERGDGKEKNVLADDIEKRGEKRSSEQENYKDEDGK